MKKQHFLIIDTETTMTNKVVDFGAVVVDRKGNILNQCAVIVQGVYRVDELFFNNQCADLWNSKKLAERYNNYDDHLKNGTRMLASVPAINKWLERVNKKYDPIMTAYNLAFDVDKMRKTGIDCDMFQKSFCLMRSAQYYIAQKKAYKQFILENHYFTNRTDYGNMSYRTTAEIMTHFLTGNDTPEPHTALEDVIDYELPIFKHITSKMSTKKMMDYKSITWRDLQIKDNFTVK